MSDSEIRALYTNRSCSQKIVMNTEVSCVQSEPCQLTPCKKEKITLENDILEREIVFEKQTPVDCPYSKSLSKYIWEPAVYFDYNKHDLTSTAKKSLNNNIRILSKFSKSSCIAIRGFTDNRGNHTYNQLLANRRAVSTMKYLQNQGVDKNRIVISPVGETAPLLPNKTEANMAINRRVEMLLLDMSGQPVPFVILTKEMQTLINKDLDKLTFCSIWKSRVLWYPGIFFHVNHNRLKNQRELRKLESNIQILKTHPEFMISIREFSSSHGHADHTEQALERIQYVAASLHQNKIHNNRIQIVPPEETLVSQSHLTNEQTMPCVEMLLLNHLARPFSVIVTLDDSAVEKQ